MTRVEVIHSLSALVSLPSPQPLNRYSTWMDGLLLIEALLDTLYDQIMTRGVR